MWQKGLRNSLKDKRLLKPVVSFEFIVVALLLMLIFWMRVCYLDADPPIGLSRSTDVYTDHPQYSLYAKMYTQTDDFNPFNDNRFVFFIKSSITALAVIIFKLSGVSIWTSNFAGLFYSFGALFLFYMFIRKVSGSLASVLFLALICSNYNHIFYSRLPFLEHAMAFFGFLSLVLLTYKPDRIGYLLAGISLAVGIFFGKVIGVIFLLPFICYFVYKFLYEDKKFKLALPSIFIIGFLAITLFWLFFSYLPMKQQVSEYIGEHTFSLYGAPEAFDSFDTFIWKFVSFGAQSWLFERMKLTSLLGTFFLGMIFYHVSRRTSWKQGFGEFNSGHIFLAIMIVSFYGALMIWNYRPLRYQLVLIYPFYGAAATVLSMLWKKWKQKKPEKVPYIFFLFCFLLVIVPFNQFYGYYIESTVGHFYYDDHKYLIAGYSLVITAFIFFIITFYKKGNIPKIPILGKVLVFVIISLVFWKGYLDYGYWWQRPTYSAHDNSLDLGMILSPGAVLSGPYAGLLTLENNLSMVNHMFGVSKADPDLFKKFPITHLLQDEANAKLALKDYPDIMDSAVHILTYHVGINKVRLFRIAGHTGNPIADSYQLSEFEILAQQYTDTTEKVDNMLAVEFLKNYPDNISCYLMLGEAAERDNFFDLAEAMFKKAVEFSPTNYNLSARLARFYHDRYIELKDPRYKEQGLNYYELAIKFAPTIKMIKVSYENLKES